MKLKSAHSFNGVWTAVPEPSSSLIRLPVPTYQLNAAIMKSLITPSIALCLSVALAASAQAATLVTYVPTGSVTSSPTGTPPAGTSVDPLISASTIGTSQLGSGSSGPIRTSGGSWTFGGGGWLFAAGNTDGGNGVASSTADYFNFTLTTPGTETLSLTSLTFDYGVGTNSTGITSNFYYAVFASVNGGGFSQIGTTFNTGSLNMTQNATNNLGVQTTDLSSIIGADSVELRVWVSSTTANGGAGSLFKNITVNGAVVPEPSAALLGGLGMLALLRRRRA